MICAAGMASAGFWPVGADFEVKASAAPKGWLAGWSTAKIYAAPLVLGARKPTRRVRGPGVVSLFASVLQYASCTPVAARVKLAVCWIIKLRIRRKS